MPAAEVRAHIEWLRTIGVGQRTIAERAGVARSTVRELANGLSPTVTRQVADRILAIGRDAHADHTVVDNAQARQQYIEVLAAGMRRIDIARAFGTTDVPIGVRQGTTITKANADRMREIHRQCLIDYAARLRQRRRAA
jgi:transcriptional regulator with XRE-family HTH domain